MNKTIVEVVGILVAAFAVQAEESRLYLMTGTTTPKRNDSYASTLVHVRSKGGVEVKETLIDARHGSEWIGVSYERHVAVLVPKTIPKRKENEIVVLDFNKAAAVKRCRIPEVPGTSSVVNQWLSDLPGQGLFYERVLFVPGTGGGKVQRMSLSAEMPCDLSFDIVRPDEVKYMVASGIAGVAGLVFTEWLRGSVDENRRIRIPATTEHHLLGYELPVAMRRNPEPDIISVVINNSHVLSVSVREDTQGNSFHNVILRKRDKTWRRLPVASELTLVRAFGPFVGVVELFLKTSSSQQSAGRAEWRKEQTATGPAQEEWFEEEARDEVYPGRLHVYDSETERLHTIVTAQADSEILLVEDNTVYYRVADRLYSAAIEGKQLGKARLVAKAEEIRDAHWAFFKRD